MKQKNSLQQIIWIFLGVFVVSIVLSPSANSNFHSFDSKQSEVLFPQSSLMTMNWQTGWGGVNVDFAEDIWADPYGYGYICGTADINTTSPKLTLSRYMVWDKGGQNYNVTWSDGTPTYGRAICCDTIYLYTAGFSSDNLILLKWNNNGTLIWNMTWNLNGNYGDVHSVCAIDDFVYMSGVYLDDLLLIKWDSSGNQLWNKTWGGIGWEEGFDVWGVGNDIYVCGSTSSYGAGLNDSLIIKWDSDGDQIWNRTTGTPFEDFHKSIFGYDNEIYVCGNIRNIENLSSDIFVTKWDSEGNEIWNHTWGWPELDDQAYSIWADEFYVYVCGTTLGWGTPYEKIIIAKYSYGGILTENSYPNLEFDYHCVPKSIFGGGSYLWVVGGFNQSSFGGGDYQNYLLSLYSFPKPPIPYFSPIEPNPSLDGTYTLHWQFFYESEVYHLYKDIHPILDISGRIPYQILTNTSFIETEMDEGTYFYIVTCTVKNYTTGMSNPRIVVVDLPDPPEKISGYNVVLLIAIIGVTTLCVYKRNENGRL